MLGINHKHSSVPGFLGKYLVAALEQSKKTRFVSVGSAIAQAWVEPEKIYQEKVDRPKMRNS